MDHHESDIYERARKRVSQKKEFYKHVAIYLTFCAFFLALNLLRFNGKYWFYWPALGWGIGLLIHYFNVFGLPGGIAGEDWESKELEKEIERQRNLQTGPPLPDDEPYPDELDLPDEEERLELKEFKKLRREWDDKDFV